MKEEKILINRYLLIDGIRGFAITNMVIFHFLYDVYIIYGKNSGWYTQPHIHIWQQAICWTFIFVSGFAWQLGMRNNFRRGIFFNICGIAISLITWHMIPTQAIWFGMLADMIAEGEKESALNYLASMGEFMENSEEYIVSGNGKIDSILNYMVSRAKKSGITVDWKIQIPEHLEISTFDINVILSNLFDNAFNALSYVPCPSLYISMKYGCSAH